MDKYGYLEYLSGDLVVLEKWILERTVSNGRSKVRPRGSPADNESSFDRSTDFLGVFDRLNHQLINNVSIGRPHQTHTHLRAA